jgi:predicted PurR-regulated permease PerM
VLVAVALGGGVMGIAGMILFIPLVSVAYRLTAEYVRNREKQTAPDQEKPLDPL